MNLFRSDEHAARWLEQYGYEPGATISAAKLSELAHAWWDTRLDPDWLPRSLDDSQAILDRLGLSDRFWQLAPSRAGD